MTEKLSEIMDVMTVWTTILGFLESSWGWDPLPALLGSIFIVCLLYMPIIALFGWLIVQTKKIIRNM